MLQTGAVQATVNSTGPLGPTAPGRLSGRAELLDRVLALIGPGTPTPLTVLAGPAGIGRSALLAGVLDRLAQREVSTVLIRVTPLDRDRPFAVLARLLGELTALAETARPADAEPDPSSVSRLPTDRVGFASALRARLGRVLATRTHLVVAFDDLHRADPESAGVLAGLLGAVDSSVACVCTVRSPADGPVTEIGAALLSRMRRAAPDAVRVVPVRPLAAGEVRSLAAEVLGATPSAQLMAALSRECRGVPAAVVAAVAGYQYSGALRVLDRCAYLVEPDRPARLPADHPIFEQLRPLGPEVLPIARALAVLAPLGAAVPGLIATAVGLAETRVRAVLVTLRVEGVLRAGPEHGYRFRVPLLAALLIGCLGPVERRGLARLAVHAIWDGAVADVEDTYLAERLTDAGRSVDPARAARELLAKGSAIMLDNGYFAQRWLAAASELTTDPDTAAGTLFLLAATCGIHMLFEPAIDTIRAVLRDHAGTFPPDILQELQIIYVVALRGINDAEALTELVTDGWRALPGDDAHRLVTRAAAMCMLNQWRRAGELIAEQTDVWQDSNDASVAYALIFAVGGAVFVGQRNEFQQYLAQPQRAPLHGVDRHRLQQTAAWSRVLLLQGELGRAQQLIADQEIPTAQLPLVDRAVLLSLSGQWEEALDLARLAVATGASLGYTPGHTGMCREMAVILLTRGRLGQARAVIEQARIDQPVLIHLLDPIESDIELMLGATQRARDLLTYGLARARRDSLTIGTDELLLRLVIWELANGEQQRAQYYEAQLAELVDTAGSGRLRRNQLIARAVLDRDTDAANEVVALCRQRDQPFELAETLSLVARHQLGEDNQLLAEAYRRYGELDALLPRARLRQLMRDRGVAIPGRAATVTENERLLAALVVEGLTNRQLATVLMTSEKAVEGRLTRLFQRTGYRSRTELGVAMLTGDYPG